MIAPELIQSKLKAALYHAGITIVISSILWVAIFLVWYPGTLSEMLGGGSLYLIIIAVELCLGPLMSLVIYNPSKPMSELCRDYGIIAIVQLAALAYGIYTIAQSRPVYVVFVKDRLEVVSPIQLSADDIKQSNDVRFKRLPLLGPELICTQAPDDSQERSALLFSALSGRDIQVLPKYYRDCHPGELTNAALPFDHLIDKVKAKKQSLIDTHRMERYIGGQYKWLPVANRFGFWSAVIDTTSEQVIRYIPFDPY